jgi:glycosyltransferase involved in cell wall biosynthesis
MKPLFSIITTTYNCGAKIDRTWESLVTQDFADFEYLIIDGNSKDGTRERLAAIKDSRFRSSSEPDQGIYDAMNKGIERARGRYLFFLGAGDLLLPGVLQKISRHLPESDAALVYGNVLMGADNLVYDGRFSRLKLCCRNICHQAIFYGRDVFKLAGNFNLKYRILADWAFNLKCFGDGRIAARFVPVTVARFETGGVSGGGDPVFEADKLSLIRTCLGNVTYERYRMHLWKEQLLAGPKQKLKRLMPNAVLAAKRKISDQLSGR